MRPSPGRALFMVHKHHARQLHYDLRLEMGGALASWAVPRGPSYDPAHKRLAVETENHALEYAEFEGRIPEGEYGAGDSIIWDRGSWDTVPPGQAEAQRKQGRLMLDLDGAKLRGCWHLVRRGSIRGAGRNGSFSRRVTKRRGRGTTSSWTGPNRWRAGAA